MREKIFMAKETNYKDYFYQRYEEVNWDSHHHYQAIQNSDKS